MMKARILEILLVMIFLSCGGGATLFAQTISLKAKTLHDEAFHLIEDTEKPAEKDLISAINMLEEATRLEPNYYEAYVELGKAHWKYGLIYIGTKVENLKKLNTYIDNARNLLEKAISLAPNRPEAYHEYFYMVKGQEREKVKHKLYELDPAHPDILTWKGYDLIEEGKIEEGKALVLKGMRGQGEREIWSQKERLAETLKKKGYNKEAEQIITEVKNEQKFYNGLNDIRYGNADYGIKLVRESVGNDLTKLSPYQKKLLAEELERKQRYKEAADVFSLLDPVKYKQHIQELREKIKAQGDHK